MKICMLPLLILCTLALNGQIFSKPPSQLKPYTIYLNAAFAPGLRTGVSLSVLDARPDSSKLGFMRKGKNEFYKIVPDQSIGQFFEKHTHLKDVGTDSGFSYLLVLRKLMLDENNPEFQLHASIPLIKNNAHSNFGRCHARIEVYLKNGERYIPLFRLDSLFTSNKPLKSCATDLLYQPFEYCLDRLPTKQSPAQLAKRKQMTIQEVIAFSFKNTLQAHALITNTKRGIYHTYSDFLNNKVDTASFSVQSGKLSDELFLQQGEQQQLLTIFWGICDGNNVFIRLGPNLFQLHPVQNTFELWGFPHLTQHYRKVSPLLLGNSPLQQLAFLGLGHALDQNKVKGDLKPLLLDAETGNIF